METTSVPKYIYIYMFVMSECWEKTRSKEVQVTTLSILSCFYIFDIKLFTFVYIHIHQHVQFLNIKILVHSLHCRKEVNNG